MEQLLLFHQGLKGFLEGFSSAWSAQTVSYSPSPVAVLWGDTAGCKPVSNKEEFVSRDRLFKSVNALRGRC